MLKTYITSHAESAPAYSEDQTAHKQVLLWAQQFLDVHQQGYVHRELKLDNLSASYTLFSDLGLE